MSLEIVVALIPIMIDLFGTPGLADSIYRVICVAEYQIITSLQAMFEYIVRSFDRIALMNLSRRDVSKLEASNLSIIVDDEQSMFIFFLELWVLLL